MINNKIIPIRKTGIFSVEVQERWNMIPKEIQNRILENVWCSNCVGSTSIIIESSKMEQKDLILRGKCKVCGNEVCRVVESE